MNPYIERIEHRSLLRWKLVHTVFYLLKEEYIKADVNKDEKMIFSFYGNFPFIIKSVVYRITPVLKVKTDIIATITMSPIVIMYVDTSKTDILVFIGNAIMCLESQWPYLSVSLSSLLLTISLAEIRGKKALVRMFCTTYFKYQDKE